MFKQQEVTRNPVVSLQTFGIPDFQKADDYDVW